MFFKFDDESLKFLIVRIESFLNIKQLSSEANHFINDDLKLNKKSMQCFWKECEINLTPTEFSLLSAITDTEEAVSINDLISATQQGVVEENTISTHILHIRKKFKKIDADFQCIKARYGFGYQWLCE